jgi:hypothetical protein
MDLTWLASECGKEDKGIGYKFFMVFLGLQALEPQALHIS